MFIVSTDKTRVVDFHGRVVGRIKEGKFIQCDCDPYYSSGLHPLEMEHVSEAIQKAEMRRNDG